MTKEQIGICLSQLGESTGAWTTLENKISNISLHCDSNYFITPKTIQFYFDDDSEILFVRHTFGKVKKIKNGDPIPEGYVSISHNGEPYIVKTERGGANDSTLGIFHEAVAYDMILGLFKQRRIY